MKSSDEKAGGAFYHQLAVSARKTLGGRLPATLTDKRWYQAEHRTPTGVSRMNRRRFLGAALGTAAVAAVSPSAVASDGLWTYGQRCGVRYGAAIRPGWLKEDPAYAEALVEECNVAVLEGQMQWPAIEPQFGQLDFKGADQGEAWARAHGIPLRGHNLISAHVVPDWLKRRSTEDVRAQLEWHVMALASRYKDKIHTWDVVNEAIDCRSNIGGPEGFRRGVFYDVLGPSYIDLAFRTARAADPAARLAYNDNRYELAGEETVQRRRATLSILRGLQERGVPLDVFGTQSHLMAGLDYDFPGLQVFLHQVGELGLEIHVTELDVSDQLLPADIATRDRAVADLTRTFMDAVLAVPAVKAVLTWGLTDRYSVLNTKKTYKRKRTDGVQSRGLPLDSELRRKPMWEAIAGALADASARG
ncbi:MAG TPA: endo-1,4-beta-xylanase [Hyphomicrobiaceae bacterium]|nr:endo-1,4-beta-xylanase [Hyphomicrobiaceae bacterium]